MNLKPIKGTGTYSIQEYKIKSGELCINGNFSSDAGWFGYTDPGMSISGGTLNFNNAANGLGAYRNMASVGKRYIISYNVVECTLGGFHIRNGNEYESIVRSTVGRYTEYITARTSGFIGIAANGTTTGRVDNVSFTEVLPLPSFKTNQRYLQCNVAGTIAFNSQQAFGVWGQNVYKGADANVRDWLFMASVIDNTSGVRQNGYFVRLGSDEKFYLYKTVNGTATALITSASTYSNSTWYDISVSRTNVGLFTLYVNNVSIGTATDLTFLSSNFTVDDWDAGDKGTNYLYKDGIRQN